MPPLSASTLVDAHLSHVVPAVEPPLRHPIGLHEMSSREFSDACSEVREALARAGAFDRPEPAGTVADAQTHGPATAS